MISIETVRNIIEDKLINSGVFIVELKISSSNKITVLIDSLEGVNIESCISLSREIEHSFDREVEDFELMVSSFGLDQPFQVHAHYQKNMGSVVEVIDNGGMKYSGTLLEVGDTEFKIGKEVKEKVEGMKKKQVVMKEFIFNYDSVKSTKLKISFK